MRKQTYMIISMLLAGLLITGCQTGSDEAKASGSVSGQTYLEHEQDEAPVETTTEKDMEESVKEQDSTDSVSTTSGEVVSSSAENATEVSGSSASADVATVQNQEAGEAGETQNMERKEGIHIGLTNHIDKTIWTIQVQDYAEASAYGENIRDHSTDFAQNSTETITIPLSVVNDMNLYNLKITYTDGTQDILPYVMLLADSTGTLEREGDLTLLKVSDQRLVAETPDVGAEEAAADMEAAQKALAEAKAEDIQNDN